MNWIRPDGETAVNGLVLSVGKELVNGRFGSIPMTKITFTLPANDVQ
ncbi:MAG: hypothetical protein H6658_08125 [Ardenticatenaceae bacterium]|nr:hypothetical protein [Ardenticatenaceae bacterium]